MENQELNHPFDQMLKQAVEGTKMPVPEGVWESVGSSISAGAVSTAKIAISKFLFAKVIAGMLALGGLGFISYRYLQSNEAKPPIDRKPDSVTAIAADKDTFEIELADNTVSNNPSLIQKATQSHDSLPMVEMYIVDETPEPERIPQSKFNDPNTVVETETTPIPAPKTKIIEEPAGKVEEKEENSQPIAFVEPPNVFTPDGDGQNDFFKIEVENEKSFYLQIFTSNGKKVFESFDKNKGWDGKDMSTGQPCERGYYLVKYGYELKSGFKRRDMRGLTLL